MESLRTISRRAAINDLAHVTGEGFILKWRGLYWGNDGWKGRDRASMFARKEDAERYARVFKPNLSIEVQSA